MSKNINVKSCLILLTLALFIGGCNRKANPVANKSSKRINTVTKTSAKGKIENFDSFYQRFRSDSLFQISRVQFPLKGQRIHFDGTTGWTKDKWLMIKASASEVDKALYNTKIDRKDDTYFEGIYCKNCGFSFEMKYQLVQGKWYLVYLQEHDE